MNEHPTVEELQKWHDGLLSQADSEEIEAHLEMCYSVCQPLLDSLFARSTTPEGTDAPEPDEAVLASFSHYQVLDVINQGGMGVILRCRDRTLDRELAIKVPRRKYVGRPGFLERFKEEAQIASQLMHPGIAPVHELGTLPDGRPYFTMKLIGGRDLAALLHERPSLAHDLPRFLSIFQQVCQTVAYAHSNNVLHRDLKPLNIRVGEFGEVQVLDWGLGKVLGGQGSNSAALLVKEDAVAGQQPSTVVEVQKVPRARLRMPSHEGEVRGTFDYMPPEQARGEISRVDKRCDVFSLGAILCEILTGEPPYVGSSHFALWEQAHKAKLASAFSRLDASVADAELVSLTKRCLAPQPDGRPVDAGRVAEAITGYLNGVEDRARKAEIERGAADSRAAEERKKRRWQLASAIAVLLALAVVGAGAALYVQDRATRKREHVLQSEATERDVTTALDDMTAALNKDRFAEAKAFLERAKGRLGIDPPIELKERVAAAERTFAGSVGLDEVRQELGMSSVIASLSAGPALAKSAKYFAELGHDPMLPDAGVAIRSSPIRQVLVTALDDWADYEPDRKTQERLWAVAREADPDPQWGDRFRDPAIRHNPAKLAALAASAPMDKLTIAQVTALVNALPPQDPTGLRLLRTCEVKHPGNFWVNYVIAQRLVQNVSDRFETNRARRKEAIGYMRTAASLRPDSLPAIVILGLLYTFENNPDEVDKVADRVAHWNRESPFKNLLLARAAANRQKYREAIEHLNRAIELEPHEPYLKHELAKLYIALGKFDEASSLMDQVLKKDPDNSTALTYKAGSKIASGRLDEGEKLIRKALALAPQDSGARALFAAILFRRGRILDVESCLATLDPEVKMQNVGACCLAFARLTRGELALAIRDLEKTASLEPNYELEIVRSLILAGEGRFVEAKASLLVARQALRANSANQIAIIGILFGLQLINIEVQLNNYIRFDKKIGDRIPTPDLKKLSELDFGLGIVNIIAADYLLAKSYCVCATRCYESALPEKAWLLPQTTIIMPGGSRISAIRAATQAWVGGGKDNIRATDKDRQRFLKLALRWLKEEVADCRSAAKRGASASLNIRIHLLKMHRDFEPLRAADTIREMPEEDRKQAEELWLAVEELYRKLNPPLNMPWEKDDRIKGKMN